MDIRSSGQSEKLVNNFLSDSSKENMNELISYARHHELSINSIAILAKGLATSGENLENVSEKICADIPSTGGPSSLSTLLCPLLLKILGYKVIKLGVPGRPAGGIDVLAQIQGYQVSPSLLQVQNWLAQSDYVHFISNENFAPLDARLFTFRRINAAINIPSLAIASLLSKKIAAGIKHVGLDVRVSSYGNFGETNSKAIENAKKFNEVARVLGMEAKCFITDGSVPYQPYIGRGEAILALYRLFSKTDDYSLRKHFGMCLQMAQAMSSSKEIINLSKIETAFFENLELQGAQIKSFYNLSKNIDDSHVHKLTASKDGHLYIDLRKIREAILKIQQLVSRDAFPDPCGIILKRMSNEYINAGETICSFRCELQYASQFENDLKSAFIIADKRNLMTDIEIIE